MRGGRSSTRDDQDRLKDSLQICKAENRKLKKEVAQLRKELQRIQDRDLDRDIDEELATPKVFKNVTDKLDRCDKCGAEDPNIIQAGKYRVMFCRGCGYKKRIDPK